MMGRVTTTVGSPSTPRGRRTRAQLVEAAVRGVRREAVPRHQRVRHRGPGRHGPRHVLPLLQLQGADLPRGRPGAAADDADVVPPGDDDGGDGDADVPPLRRRRRRRCAGASPAPTAGTSPPTCATPSCSPSSSRSPRSTTSCGRSAGRCAGRSSTGPSARSSGCRPTGLALGDVDARYAASALGSMVDRFAYVWLVLDEPFEFEEAARTLGLLWTRSLGLVVPTGEAVPASSRDDALTRRSDSAPASDDDDDAPPPAASARATATAATAAGRRAVTSPRCERGPAAEPDAADRQQRTERADRARRRGRRRGRTGGRSAARRRSSASIVRQWASAVRSDCRPPRRSRPGSASLTPAPPARTPRRRRAATRRRRTAPAAPRGSGSPAPHGPLDADPAQVPADGEHGAAGDGQEGQQRPGAGDRRTAARAGGRRRRRRAGRAPCGSRPGTSARWPA